MPKTRNGGTMTEAAYWGMVRAGLRRTFRWWKPLQAALKAAERPYKGPNKRQKKEYQCAGCGQWGLRRTRQVHHRVPCGKLTCPADLAGFLERLTPEDPNLFAVLCKKCHKKQHHV